MDEMLFGYEFEDDIELPPSEDIMQQFQNAVFPTAFCIDSKYITPVKKQHVGACWAFAATAMMETFLLKNGMTKGATSDKSIFSETHMIYSVFDIGENLSELVNSEGLKPLYNDATKQYFYGCNRTSPISYFSKGLSSVLEVIDPDFLKSLPDPILKLPKREDSITKEKFRNFEVRDILIIDDAVIPGSKTFINQIKYCLMTHGIVAIAYYEHDDCTMVLSNDPKYGSTTSYYCKDFVTRSDTGGHAVAIVGWDDEFNIFKNSPGNPGAFKVKNCWGTGGELGDGYRWISYEDCNLTDGYCITEMQQVDLDAPRKIYTNAKFGITKFLPRTRGATKSEFTDVYTTEDDYEEITAVGLYNLTPCLAKATLHIDGLDDIILFEEEYLEYPGFHRVPVDNKEMIDAKGTEFSIIVEYEAVGMFGTYIPTEYKLETRHENLKLDEVKGSIVIPGFKGTIQQYNTDHKTSYGNLAMYVSTRCYSVTAGSYTDAYNSLQLPGVNANGLLSPLPNEVTPPGSSAGVPIEWRVEPFDRKKYDTSYTSPVTWFKLGNSKGLFNNTAAPCKVYFTACIGTGSFKLRKTFSDTLPTPNTNLDFTISEVKNCNQVTLSGQLAGVPNATVEVHSNNMTETVKTDKDGKWKITDYQLYDPNKEGGWKDEYASTEITVQIKSDDGFVLAAGKKTVALERPFDLVGTVVTVTVATAGVIGLVIAIRYCIHNRIAVFRIVERCLHISLRGYRRFGNAGQVNMNFNGAILNDVDNALFEEVGDVADVHMRRVPHMNNVDGVSASDDCFAGLALKVRSGSTISNCSVSGTVDGVKSIGGLFYEGENVTVKDCSVDLTTSCIGECGGLAHSISGNSSLSNVTVRINGSGTNVAGIAVNLSGTVSQCNVSMTATASGNVAGVCCNADGAEIKNVVADCDLSVSADQTGTVAGIASQMKGSSTVSNCVVIGKINAGGKGTAYGIGQGILNNASAVSNCLCAASFINAARAFRISEYTGNNCMAYCGIVNSNGTSFAATGETLMQPADILSVNTFTSHGFDMTNIWEFDSRKGILFLKDSQDRIYKYPFPNPYATKSGKYQFAINSELVLYGASNPNTSKVTWGGLTPEDNSNIVMRSSDQYMLAEDEFYLQAHLMITAKGNYTMDVVSVIDGHRFGNNIRFEVV